MAYRMPGKYSSRGGDSESDDDERSVDISIDNDYESHSEYEESFRDDEDADEDDEEEEDRRPRRSHGGGSRSSSSKKKGPPRRAKSFQEDDPRLRGGGGGGGGSSHRRSIHGGGGGDGGGGGRRMPRRSKTFDNSRQSIRMPRRDTTNSSMLDKEAIASNRARRLRAMGDGGKGSDKNVKLTRRSSSFRTDSKRNLLGDSFSNHNEDDNEEKKDEHSRSRKPLRRSTSNDLSALAPEERQYARTAARGVTRSKSLKAERPNLDRASKSVAARLGKLRVSSNDAPTGLKF